MEKLQLKMRMLNVAVTKEMWEGFDLLERFWKSKGVNDEDTIAGSIFSAGVNTVLNDLGDLANRTPEMMKEMEGIVKKNRADGYDPNKTNINDCFDVTI